MICSIRTPKKCSMVRRDDLFHKILSTPNYSVWMICSIKTLSTELFSFMLFALNVRFRLKSVIETVTAAIYRDKILCAQFIHLLVSLSF